MISKPQLRDDDYCLDLITRIQQHTVSNQVSLDELNYLNREVDHILTQVPEYLKANLTSMWNRVRDHHPISRSRHDTSVIVKIIHKVCNGDKDFDTDSICLTIDFLLLCTGLPGKVDNKAMAFLNSEILKVLHKHQATQMMERWQAFFTRGFSRRERESFRKDFNILCLSEPMDTDDPQVEAGVPLEKPIPDIDHEMWGVPDSGQESIGLTASMLDASQSDQIMDSDPQHRRSDVHTTKPSPITVSVDEKEFDTPSRVEFHQEQVRLANEKKTNRS
jgi:hypothetical protein